MMGSMKDLSIQMSLPFGEDVVEGKVFELYVKNGKREFQRHVKFIQADCLEEAEDNVVGVNPDYWKTMSVRPVKPEYIWKTFEDLHVAYNTCKSILGLDELLENS